MATQLDEGVGNLERLCTLLAQTNEELKGHNTDLESRAGALEELQDAAGEELHDLRDALEAFEDRVKSDGGDAASAVDDLAASARALADDALGGVEEEIGAAESAFAQKLDGDRADLEAGASELTTAGFEVLSSGVESAEGGLQASGQEAEAAFGAFEGEVQGLEQEVQAFQSETAAALSAAAEGLSGEVAEGLSSDGTECVSAWMDELPASLESGCSSAEAPVAAAYAALAEEGQGAGDELMEKVSTSSSEGAGFLLDEQGGHLQEAGSVVIEQAVPDLLGELGSVQSTVETGAQTAGALEPMVGELEISKKVVADVDQLLSAIGG